MRAVNLIPTEAGRSRVRGGGSGRPAGTLGPSHVLVALLAIIVGLIVLRVLADNTVNNRKSTLAAVQAQVAAEQAQAAKLTPFVNYVLAAQAQENQVEEIANSRFPWKTKLDDLAHVLPTTTSLTSLSGTISGAAGSTSGAATAAAGTPTFTLVGCANTPNQNGTATLLRRLNELPGVTAVNFDSSTRVVGCGNSFNLSLDFAALPGVVSTAGSATGSATAGTSTTTTTTTPAATTTTGATTG